jgi:hypothetical protein
VPALVSVSVAMDHLRVVDDAEYASVERMALQATSIVLDYIARPTDEDWTATIAAWTETTVPPVIQAAILVQLTELYRFRGDDMQMPEREAGDLSPLVKALLRRSRDPVVA